ncbi:histone deacetylase family protein [Rhodoligotrophos defluvii]|uniref:histone deacetylase family protein n=1 Tax=Rhodoligotrophos defluvii TaxID=2561934 RepID=UPI0010C998E2|nr:histone deacetylase family protein [Rhodoligotrophos defluvii]
MITVFHEHELGHRVRTRLSGGRLIDAVETPERLSALLEAAKQCTSAIVEPGPAAMDVIQEIHDRGYLHFLETGFAAWKERFPDSVELRPSLHISPYMRRLPEDLLGRAGYYINDAASVLVEDTWPAVLASAASALEATRRVLDGAPAAYALCRPPGHHAYPDMACGYCFLNNGAIAAARARRSVERVTILDVDVHHGNGTQAIFYGRPDVQTISVHADPSTTFPFYAGYADERGAELGEGFNLNLPVAPLSGDEAYLAAVEEGIAATRDFSPDMVILPLGLDASEADPFACMRVTSDGFARMGEMLGAIGRPTVIIQEGGYPSPILGLNLIRFMEGFRATSGA